MPFTYYRKMATKHPESLSAQYNYGSVLLNVGQYSEAIERLELCLELLEGGAGDREADIRYNLGLAYEASELPMPALEQFRVVVSLLPNDVDAAAKLAAILQAHSGPSLGGKLPSPVLLWCDRRRGLTTSRVDINQVAWLSRLF